MGMTVGTALCAALLVTARLAAANAGQKTGPVTPPLVIDSMYGPDLYHSYCATCHGRDGKGKGPVAVALKKVPPDLTLLGRSQNGTFPAGEVEAIIRGDGEVAAHGSSDMPVWGPIFYALDPSDARVKTRIRALVAYLASIQRK